MLVIMKSIMTWTFMHACMHCRLHKTVQMIVWPTDKSRNNNTNAM